VSSRLVVVRSGVTNVAPIIKRSVEWETERIRSDVFIISDHYGFGEMGNETSWCARSKILRILRRYLR
jgi:hypothetical protein